MFLFVLRRVGWVAVHRILPISLSDSFLLPLLIPLQPQAVLPPEPFHPPRGVFPPYVLIRFPLLPASSQLYLPLLDAVCSCLLPLPSRSSVFHPRQLPLHVVGSPPTQRYGTLLLLLLSCFLLVE